MSSRREATSGHAYLDPSLSAEMALFTSPESVMDWLSLFAFLFPVISVLSVVAFVPGVALFFVQYHSWIVGGLFFFARAEATAFEWCVRAH